MKDDHGYPVAMLSKTTTGTLVDSQYFECSCNRCGGTGIQCLNSGFTITFSLGKNSNNQWTVSTVKTGADLGSGAGTGTAGGQVHILP